MAEAVETQARQLGWVPKEQFRGDEAKWVDAATFVKRGEEIMPILRANNQRLQGEVDSLKGALTEAQTAVQSAQEAIAALKEHQTETTLRAVKVAKTNLIAQIAAAREAGDTQAEFALMDQLDEVKDNEREAKKAPAAVAPAAAPAAQKEDPAWTSWKSENPWWGVDRRRTALTLAEAEEMRSDPANKGLVGKAFFDKAAEAADAVLNPRATSSKVESGTGSASARVPKGGGAKTFDDLPQEAKDVCNRQAEKLVGAGRAFKDKAAWQAHYVEQYFLGE